MPDPIPDPRFPSETNTLPRIGDPRPLFDDSQWPVPSPREDTVAPGMEPHITQNDGMGSVLAKIMVKDVDAGETEFSEKIGRIYWLKDEDSGGISFHHFKVKVISEPPNLNAYVCKGVLLGMAQGRGDAEQFWPVESVTHQGQNISLATEAPVFTLPFEDGLTDLQNAGAGVNLTNNTTYFVHLKMLMGFRNHIHENSVNNDDSDWSTTLVEAVQNAETRIATTWPTSLDTQNPNGTGDFYRYFPLAIIEVDAQGTPTIYQLHDGSAVYQPLSYRGRGVPHASGLEIALAPTPGYLVNSGVLTVTDDGGAVTVDNTDPQNPIVTNP